MNEQHVKTEEFRQQLRHFLTLANNGSRLVIIDGRTHRKLCIVGPLDLEDPDDAETEVYY